MARKDIIMLSQRELKRLHVIKKVFEEVMKQVEAAEMLSLSDRQIRRLIKKVRIEGDAGIAHKSRGKPSNRRLPKEIKDGVIELYRERLKGFGLTLAVEKLLEIGGIKHTIATFWWKMIQVAGRIVKHSGSIILKIAAGMERLDMKYFEIVTNNYRY